MPLPKPREDEDRGAFVGRCMSELKEEFPDQAQRAAVCYAQWRRKGEDKMRSWYEIKNATTDEADVLIYDEIGFWGVTAGEFVDALRDVTAQTINLHINSPGGDVFDGFAIYNALRNHPAKVTAYVDGLAASAASFIAQAGDRRVVSKTATMMVHEPFGMTEGPSGDHAKMADTLDKMGQTIAEIYAERAGGTVDGWRTAMREETWYRAMEAVQAGLADEVQHYRPKASAATRKAFNLSRFKNVPDWVEQDKTPPPPKDEGATPDPSPSPVLEAIKQGVSEVYTKKTLPPEYDFGLAVRVGLGPGG